MVLPIGLCIVGCGHIAKRHADSARALGPERVKLYFASRSIDRAHEYAELYMASGYFGSYEEAAADARVNALLFCTPHNRHLADVVLAATNGKAAIVEKPIARTLAEADEMIATAKQYGIPLIIAENYPYKVPIGAVRRMVRSGALGDLKHISLTYTRYIEPTGWRTDAEQMGGGALIDGGIHMISALTNIAGETESVFAMRPPQTVATMPGEDSIAIMAKLKSGAIGQLTYSWAIPSKTHVQSLSAFGSKGSIHADLSTGAITHITDAGEKTWRADSNISGSTSMFADFVEALARGKEPMITVKDCRRDLAIVLACYESLKSGAVISL